MVEIEEFPISLSDEVLEPMVQIPSELPVLPLRDIVIYPFMIVPLFVSRDRSIRAVEQGLKEDRMILLVSQKDVNKEEPEQEDLYTVGTVAIIMRMLKLPDGRIRILIQGLSRCQVDSVAGKGEYVKAAVTPISEPLAPENSLEVEALIRNVRGSMERATSLGKNISPEVLAIIANLDDAGRLADLSASNLDALSPYLRAGYGHVRSGGRRLKLSARISFGILESCSINSIKDVFNGDFSRY